MHQSSYEKMARFAQEHLASRCDERLVIADLGSADINGSYQPLFQQPKWKYIGIDLTPGRNVDVVLRDPYHWRELEDGSVDVLISGQTFEHTEFFWMTALEIFRVLKPRGLCCLIAPSAGPEHRFPQDCWRILPDGLQAIARYARLEVVECYAQYEDLPQYDSESNKWHDAVLVARKPARATGGGLRLWLQRLLLPKRRGV